jgi:hypothetical protein
VRSEVHTAESGHITGETVLGQTLVGPALNNRGIIPRGNPSCPFVIGIKQPGLVTCV